MGGWLPPGTMVWPERWCPISCAMMLTGAQLLDLVACMTSPMKAGL